MHTTLPADPYEKQLVKLEQTIKATGFAHIMSQTQFAHRAHQDARQSHSDALNTQLSIIGTGTALQESFEREFSSIAGELENVNSGISSVNSAVWSVDNSINRLGKSLIAQLQKAEESQNRNFEEMKLRVDHIVSTLSTISLQMVTQNEILLDSFRMQEKMFSNIISTIDNLHETTKNPLQTQARELRNRGLQSYNKQLLTEAKEDFFLAIEKHKTEPMTHYFLAKIYLYGITEDENLIDIDSGISELKLAQRYTKPDLGKEKQIDLFYAEILKHLAKAYYMKAKFDEVRNG